MADEDVRRAAVSKAQRSKRPVPTDFVDYEKFIRSDKAKFDPNVDMEIINPNLDALKKKRGSSPSPQSKLERIRQAAERFGEIDEPRAELDEQLFEMSTGEMSERELDSIAPRQEEIIRKLQEAYKASERQFQKDFGADVAYSPAQAELIYKAYQTMDDQADIDRVVNPILESLRTRARRKQEAN